MTDTNPYFFSPEWPVFYEDNHLLALYKPAGLLVQGDISRDVTLIDIAKQWIKMRYHKPGDVYLGLPHRLDRPVAGVILICRTSKAAGRMTQQFRTGRVKKQYMAVLEGELHQDAGALTHHLERRRNTSRIVDEPTETSQEARLSFRVLEIRSGKSFVEVDLGTGRHHQIRVQMAQLGCPVLGDLRYGASKPLPRRQLALLARSLSIFHPTLDHPLTFHCPFPQGWPWDVPERDASSPPWSWEALEPAVMAASGLHCPLKKES
jgi:23S rRNA pseudouridine1911/1915/1917 synthase